MNRPTSPRSPQIGRLHHVSIRATNWAGSLRFYESVLGLTRTSHTRFPNGKELVMFGNADGTLVELVSPVTDASTGSAQTVGGPIAHLAFEVNDVAATLESVRTLGYPVTVEPTRLDQPGLHATIAFFNGPNGESIELIRDHENAQERG